MHRSAITTDPPTPVRRGPLLRMLRLLTAAALLASACGSGDSDTADSPASESEPATRITAAEATAAATVPLPSTTTETALQGTGGEDERTAPSASDDSDDSDATDAETPAKYGFGRIVSISPTGTEMLYAIGAGDRVVAVDEYSYYPPEAPVTDLSGWNPNIEAIASYEPDLVVMQNNGEVVASLEALGITVLTHDAPTTFDDVYAQFERFGETTDQIDEAARFVAAMRAEIADLVAAAPDASGLTYYHELDDTLYSVTSGTFVGLVYSLFGLENVADPADEDGSAYGYPQISDEYLLDADPDLIFLADTRCCAQDAETVAARPGWGLLSAVENGRVIELDDDVASRWGPRLVDFIAAISAALVSLDADG